MTRGEALIAMEGGARVDGFYHGKLWSFWLDGTEIDSNYESGANKSDLFLLCSDFQIATEPDTAEKFVREFNATCPSGPLPDYWETFIQKFFKRSNDLIQQMDGEK